MLNQPSKNPTELKIIHLNKNQQKSREQLLEAMNDKHGLKQLKKILAKTAKQALKDNLRGKNHHKKKVFVLDFYGNVKAQAVTQFREEVSAVISVAKKGDEVVVRLESGGGLVNAYGLAASQLIRLKEAELHLTICVDKVAASGGYMMACVADKILSGPFAVTGSIGVIAQMPNFNKWLKNHEIDYEMFMAGDYKRTITVFGENNEEDRKKFQEEIEQTHKLFKHFIETYRPTLDLEKVATGEHWYGEDSIKLGLIDEIKTSDSYLLELMKDHDIYALHTRKKPTLAEKIGLTQASVSFANMAIDRLPDIIQKTENYYRLKISK